MRKYLILILVCLVATPAAATMTSDTDKEILECNGETGPYSYGFKIWNDDDIKVIQTDGNNVDTLLTLTSDYTVSGAGDDAGGFVTLVTACPDGSTLTLIPVLDYTQESDYIDGAPFAASTIENDLDYTVSLSKQNAEAIDRAIKFPESCTNCDDIDVARPTASAYLMTNSAADSIVMSTSIPSTLTDPDFTNFEDYDSFSDALTSIGSTVTLLLVHRATESLAGPLIVHENTTLWVTTEGVINVGSGTLTINGPIIADRYQIFTGLGTIALGSHMDEIYPEWWGAMPGDSTTDSAQIQKALDSKDMCHVSLAAGDYVASTTITVNQNKMLSGQGKAASTILWEGTDDQAIHVVNSAGASSYCSRFVLRDFRVQANHDDSDGKIGIEVDGGFVSEIRNVGVWYFDDTDGTGIKMEGGSGRSVIETNIAECQIVTCRTGILLTGDDTNLVTESRIRNTRISYKNVGADVACNSGFIGINVEEASAVWIENVAIGTDDTSLDGESCIGIKIRDTNTKLNIVNPYIERLATAIDHDDATDIWIWNSRGCCGDTNDHTDYTDNGDLPRIMEQRGSFWMENYSHATDDGRVGGHMTLGNGMYFHPGHFDAPTAAKDTETLVDSDYESMIAHSVYSLDDASVNDRDNNAQLLHYADSVYGCDAETEDCMQWRLISTGAWGEMTCKNAAFTLVSTYGLSSANDMVELIPKNNQATLLASGVQCASGDTQCGVIVLRQNHVAGNADASTKPTFRVDHDNLTALIGAETWTCDAAGVGADCPEFYYRVINAKDFEDNTS